eukprot:SAG31_NODE_457_length_15415_cov_4.380387_5_plen_220_part_00
MVVEHLPRHLRGLAQLPPHARVHLGQQASVHAVMGKLGGSVIPCVPNLGRPGRSASQSAHVRDGRRPWGAPRVVLVNILWRAGRRAEIKAARVIWQRRLHAEAADIRLHPSRHVVALGAADGAALAVVKTRLAVPAVCRVRARHVRAVGVGRPVPGRIHVDHVVPGVATARRDDRAVADDDRRNERQQRQRSSPCSRHHHTSWSPDSTVRAARLSVSAR